MGLAELEEEMQRNTKIAVGALTAALMVGGLVGAVADEGDIGSFRIKDGGVYSPDLHDNGVRSVDVRDGGVHEEDLGPNVQTKLNTDADANHVDEPYGADLPGQDSSDTTVPAGQTEVVWVACVAGEHATGGGYRIGDLSQESFSTGNVSYPDLQVIASEAAYYQDGGLVNGALAAPVNDNLSYSPNAWAVTVHNAGATDSVARSQVVCED